MALLPHFPHLSNPGLLTLPTCVCAQGYKLRSRLLQLRVEDPSAVLPEDKWREWLAVSVQCQCSASAVPMPAQCMPATTYTLLRQLHLKLLPALFWSACLACRSAIVCGIWGR